MPAHQHKVGLGLGQRRRLTQSKRHIGPGQHGAVVQAIADHGHAVALGLPRLEQLQFVLWVARALGIGHTHGARHLGHSARAVTRQNFQLQAHLLELRHHTSGFWANLFGQLKGGQPTPLVGQADLHMVARKGRGLAKPGRAQPQRPQRLARCQQQALHALPALLLHILRVQPLQCRQGLSHLGLAAGFGPQGTRDRVQ